MPTTFDSEMKTFREEILQPYLAPCLPPLLGLIKTAKGCVPRRGEICQENFVVSSTAFIRHLHVYEPAI